MYPKLHNAMWPGVVGKGDGDGLEPALGLEEMLDRTAAAEADGARFDGVDLFLFEPHLDPYAGEDSLTKVVDSIATRSLRVGTLVAPVWPGTVGDSAMGDEPAREKFLEAVRVACRVARVFDESGVRDADVIRIDSAEFGIERWRSDPRTNTARIAAVFREAASIAADAGQRLAAEGEVCWAGMHSWRDMLDLLEAVDRPATVGFQADLAHTYLYLLGTNAPEHALLSDGYSAEEFEAAYAEMVSKLRPWTIDLHIAQNDGTVLGAGSHDKTGRHCLPDDPQGKLDIVACAAAWLVDAADRGIRHVCWDGCMFPNDVLRSASTWDNVLKVMTRVRAAHGWG
ncbi:MAG: TIM barrel protein [Planctomycetota bacterium]